MKKMYYKKTLSNIASTPPCYKRDFRRKGGKNYPSTGVLDLQIGLKTTFSPKPFDQLRMVEKITWKTLDATHE